jgi:uncharacterized protein (DUF1330 family)
MEQFIDPSPENFAHFKSLDRSTPILMLNMIRFREQADYPADHPNNNSNITGAQAYSAYGEHSGPVFSRVGGQIVWRGIFEGIVIGPSDEYWDTVFIARYPNAHAFLEMVKDPNYAKAVIHRQAAVATSRLIRFAESSSASALFSD